MKIKNSFSALVLSLVTIWLPAHARDYAIEVILFAHVDGLNKTQEQFPVDQRIISSNDGLVIDNEFPSSHSMSNESDQTSHLWRAVPESEFILTDAVAQLERSSKYRVLQHLAWIQPMVDKNNTHAIRINGGRELSSEHPERLPAQAVQNPRLAALFGNLFKPVSNSELYELEGTISVAITRYIHVYADLVFRAKDYNVVTTEQGLLVADQLQDFKINLYRKMKSRELHYLDHPLIGMLVEATPIEQQEDSQ